MLRDVTCNPSVSYRIFVSSTIPIKYHVTLISPLQQEIIEKMSKVIVVGFATERERAAVLKENANLQRECLEQLVCGDSSFTFKNVLPLHPQALPWQKAPKKVKKNVSEGLQIISPS